MYQYIQHWLYFLNVSDSLIGIPLCAAGVALVIAGWRMWLVVGIISLGVVGGVLGHMVAVKNPHAVYYAIAGAVLFGLVGFASPRNAATLLGGIIGGVIVSMFLGTLGLTGSLQQLGMVLGFAAAMAFAYSNRQQIVAIITSVEGGILLISGFAVLVREWPFLNGFFNSMVRHSPLMVMFLILVPSVIGVLLQQADAARAGMKEQQGTTA